VKDQDEPEDRPLVRWARHTVFALFLFATPFVEWMMIQNLRSSLRSNSWPTAEGNVLKSEVATDLRRGQPVYSAEVEYDYSVQGKAYHGAIVRVGNMTTKSRMDAEGIVAQFPVGKPVAVHYDPADPSACCLIPGTHWTHYLVVVTPVLFWIMSVGYFHQMWSNRKGRSIAPAGGSG
jgi:Protein of unknown function (DUF3592)